MAIILHIEASTDVCSVSLSESGAIFFNRENHEGCSHSTCLAPFVEEAISIADSKAMPLDAVALSCGPGSYTGLRIGSSTAKGICYGREIPLIALPTLKIMSVPILLRDELPENTLLCPMLDARRLEVYSAIYDRGLNEIERTKATIIDKDSFSQYLEKHPVYFFGTGANKCKEYINHENAHFVENKHPLAKWMFPLAEKSWVDEQFEDIAYFEPFYLKDFIATKPRELL